MSVIALPLNHAKPTFGYLLEGFGERGVNRRMAYLSDSLGVPDASAAVLMQQRLDCLLDNPDALPAGVNLAFDGREL